MLHRSTGSGHLPASAAVAMRANGDHIFVLDRRTKDKKDKGQEEKWVWGLGQVSEQVEDLVEEEALWCRGRTVTH